MIGKRLEELRKTKDMSKKEVADILKIHETTYGKYELGFRNPDLNMVLRLSDFFCCSLDYLLKGTNDFTEDEMNLIRAYQQLSDQGQEYIRQSVTMAMAIYKKEDSVTDIESEGKISE